MTRCCGDRFPVGAGTQCTGGDITPTTEPIQVEDISAAPVMAGTGIGSSSSSSSSSRSSCCISIDTRPHRIELQDSTSRHLSASGARVAATGCGRPKTIISSLSALKYPRRPVAMLAATWLVALQLLLSASPSPATATSHKQATLNELQQKAAASAVPLAAGIPTTTNQIHSSSSISNTNSEQLHAARSPLSLASRLPAPTVDGGPAAAEHESSFLLVSPLARWHRADVIRRIGRAASAATKQLPAAKRAGNFMGAEEPTCKQLTGAWRTLRLYYPTLVEHLFASLFSNNPGPHLPHMNIGKVLAYLDKSLAPHNPQSSQHPKLANGAMIAKLASNPFYYNIFRRYIDNLNTPPEYLNRVDTPDFTTDKPTDKEVIYGRLVKHPNEWTNNQIARTNEKLHYLKLLSKQFESDIDEQQQQPPPPETQPEDASMATSMPMYGRVVSNPSELSPDSLLNRRRITSENLEKLRKLARSDIGYD